MSILPPQSVIIVQNQETDPEDTLRLELEAALTQRGIRFYTTVLPSRSCLVVPPGTPEKPDLIIVLGGDGTFLRTAHCFAQAQIPMVGVNTGHLGFLTRIEANRLEAYLTAICSGMTRLETRMMLAVSHVEGDWALNDVVVKNANTSRLATIHVFEGTQLLATYDADGVIVATPSGSTAYNLSAGGPIMDPAVDVLAITPICPHSLSAKPIVLPANRVLTIQSDVSNSGNLVCALDGDDAFTLSPGQAFQLGVAPERLPVLTFFGETDSFYTILKRKLGWGANPRAAAKASKQPGSFLK